MDECPECDHEVDEHDPWGCTVQGCKCMEPNNINIPPEWDI